MNILAVDYGEKRIGLAWVQAGLDVVLPFGQIRNDKSKIINDELIKLIKNENIDKVVVGLPKSLDGGENENTKKVKEFADNLKESSGVEVELFDERFSSRQADNMGGGASRDEKSAMVILQSYLDKK